MFCHKNWLTWLWWISSSKLLGFVWFIYVLGPRTNARTEQCCFSTHRINFEEVFISIVRGPLLFDLETEIAGCICSRIFGVFAVPCNVSGLKRIVIFGLRYYSGLFLVEALLTFGWHLDWLPIGCSYPFDCCRNSVLVLPRLIWWKKTQNCCQRCAWALSFDSHKLSC